MAARQRTKKTLLEANCDNKQGSRSNDMRFTWTRCGTWRGEPTWNHFKYCPKGLHERVLRLSQGWRWWTTACPEAEVKIKNSQLENGRFIAQVTGSLLRCARRDDYQRHLKVPPSRVSLQQPLSPETPVPGQGISCLFPLSHPPQNPGGDRGS